MDRINHDQSGSLTLSDVRKEDGGEYECVAMFDEVSATATTKLVIRSKLENSNSSLHPLILESPHPGIPYILSSWNPLKPPPPFWNPRIPESRISPASWNPPHPITLESDLSPHPGFPCAFSSCNPMYAHAKSPVPLFPASLLAGSRS